MGQFLERILALVGQPAGGSKQFRAGAIQLTKDAR
jgi:hypothetical protein